MPLNHRRQTAWPLRPNGMRRRASASQVLEPGFKVSRPASWLLRVFALVAIAVPSLLVTSPGYVAFADKLPDPDAVTSATPEDTLIYAADNTTLLADLHPPGYQAYFEPLSQMGSLLPAAVISIEDRNFYSEPGIDPQGIVRASIVDLRTHSNAEGASTITQQLVKLRLVGNDATLDRKITAADAAKAFVEDLSPPAHMFMPSNQAVAPSFVRYVTSILINQFGAEATYSGGMRVVTTLNPRLQDLAQRDVSQNIAKLRYRNVTQGALVSLDPTTGAIIAMVGSANPNAYGGQYNLAVWPPRNPGSSMKIYTYTAAIASKKFTMTTPIRDSRFTYREPGSTESYTPRNYDGKTHGTCQLQACMGNSLNIPAVKVELGVGVASVVQMARAMGAPPYQQHGVDAYGNPLFTTNDPLNSYGASLTLGGYGETPLQMAIGASVLATQGLLRQPYAINMVKSTSTGQVIYSHPADPGKRVLDARVAYIMQMIMSNDNNRAMIFGHNSLLTLPGRKVAVDNRTSDCLSYARAGGFTPHIVTAVWGGNADWRMKMTKNSDSYYIAAPMWHRFMQDALDALHMPNEWYSQPAGLITAKCHGQTAWYLPGTHC